MAMFRAMVSEHFRCCSAPSIERVGVRRFDQGPLIEYAAKFENTGTKNEQEWHHYGGFNKSYASRIAAERN